MTPEKPSFRVLELYAPYDEGKDHSQYLTKFLENKPKTGYLAFYCCNSGVIGRRKTLASELRSQLMAGLETHAADRVIDPCLQSEIETLKPGTLYVQGSSLSPGYAAKIREFIGKLRNTLADEENNPFNQQAAYALNHATVYTVLGDPHEHSRVIDETLGYKEYLLWDDGGLWEQKDWEKRVADLANLTDDMTKQEKEERLAWAEQRLAWTGAGWMSLQFEHMCDRKTEAWPTPPELAVWANSALTNLKQYDLALAEYFQEKQKRDPPGLRPCNDYIRCLCNFLPDHRSRTNPGKWLSSNTLGEQGGPRLWQGMLDGRLHMHLWHLLLDGWLTLWPVEKEGGRIDLYLQPGSLALLYWAANFADMPHTESPQAFLENYDWSDGAVKWFGGRREHWLPKR